MTPRDNPDPREIEDLLARADAGFYAPDDCPLASLEPSGPQPLPEPNPLVACADPFAKATAEGYPLLPVERMILAAEHLDMLHEAAGRDPIGKGQIVSLRDVLTVAETWATGTAMGPGSDYSTILRFLFRLVRKNTGHLPR